jgi:hypothetical protein
MGQLVMLKTSHSHWLHYDELMNPPINILVDFNEFIQKHGT